MDNAELNFIGHICNKLVLTIRYTEFQEGYSSAKAGKDGSVVHSSGDQMDWECLDLPAWPVHPSHHAFHCVPPQDGNAQFLDGIGVRCGLVAAAGSLLVKSIAERSPQTGTGNHNDPLPSRFACTRQICFIQSTLGLIHAQQGGEGILLQGVVFSLAHGQCHRHRVALEQECRGKNDGHDGLSHGEDLPSVAKPWCCG